MVGGMGASDIAAVVMIVVTPIALVVSDVFGTRIVATAQRLREWWVRVQSPHHR